MQPACHLFLHGFVHLLPMPGLAVNHDTDSRGLEDRVQGDGCPRPVLSSVRGRWTGGGRVPTCAGTSAFGSRPPPLSPVYASVCVSKSQRPKWKLGKKLLHTCFSFSLVVAVFQPRMTSLCNLGSGGFAEAGRLRLLQTRQENKSVEDIRGLGRERRWLSSPRPVYRKQGRYCALRRQRKPWLHHSKNKTKQDKTKNQRILLHLP